MLRTCAYVTSPAVLSNFQHAHSVNVLLHLHRIVSEPSDTIGLMSTHLLVQDTVYSIREAATRNLQRLAEEFGPDWARDHVVPRVLALIQSSNYLYRMTVLAAVTALAPAVPRDVLCNTMLPAVINASKDKVWGSFAVTNN